MATKKRKPKSTRITAENIKLKRAYERPARKDGTRVLIDRLWPRGVRKGEASIDLWIKDIAPSTGLRKWFGHDPGRWPEFRRRYAKEIRDLSVPLAELRSLVRRGPVTLVYSAHDELHNDAVVLRDILLGRPTKRHRTRSSRSAKKNARTAKASN
jgi:uncharacterized protein YeaO (DUF488 family)